HGGEPLAAAVVAARAGLRIRVVKLAVEDLHPAVLGRLVVEHGPGLVSAEGRDLLIAFPVIGPPQPGRGVSALALRYCVLDFEGLEQKVEPGSLGPDEGLEAGYGKLTLRLGQCREHAIHIRLLRYLVG